MSDTTMQLQLGKQKVVDDLKVLLADTEEMLRLTATASGEGVDVVRKRLQSHVETAKITLADAQVSARAKYREAAGNADDYVRKNPWQAVGCGVGFGILLGVLAAR
jgi:ElaB/YqjD/DUF883 family membrane-anchored ribosome-binding protein